MLTSINSQRDTSCGPYCFHLQGFATAAFRAQREELDSSNLPTVTLQHTLASRLRLSSRPWASEALSHSHMKQQCVWPALSTGDKWNGAGAEQTAGLTGLHITDLPTSRWYGSIGIAPSPTPSTSSAPIIQQTNTTASCEITRGDSPRSPAARSCTAVTNVCHVLGAGNQLHPTGIH